jgi:hypothetical protein
MGTTGNGAVPSAWTGTPVVPETMSVTVVVAARMSRHEYDLWCISYICQESVDRSAI